MPKITSTKDKSIATREAAKRLGVSPPSVSQYVSRGRLKSTGVGFIDEASLEAYLKKRSDPHRAAGLQGISGTKIRKLNRNTRKNALYLAVLVHFSRTGTAPIFDDLVDAVGLAKSGLSRYLKPLVKEGKLEVMHHRIYPKGLPEKIADLVQKEYKDDIEKYTKLVDEKSP